MRASGSGNSMAGEEATLCRRWLEQLKSRPGRVFLGLLVWFSFLKLPASARLDAGSSSWEAVLAFAAAHHLQWGRDIIFTYGPLGFLTSDHYWGNFYWLILCWSAGFSLLLTVVLLRFSKRLRRPVRIALYLGLPLLTIPRCIDLGVDPICLFAITAVGLACFPEERPGTAFLGLSGLMLAVLSLIKFTFCLYGLFALLTIVAAHLIRGGVRPAGVLLGSSLASFFAAWLLAGQGISHIGPWFQSGVQIASGYSSAMSIAPPTSDGLVGMLIWLGIIGLVWVHWRGSREPLADIPRIGLILAGVFLAWKEGFVRADSHVAVFLLYAFLLAATLPVFFKGSGKGRFFSPALTAATMAIALVPFGLQDSDFTAEVRDDAIPKLKDTFTAIFAPARFKQQLEAHLESRRQSVLLPQIAAMVGDASIGVLGYWQDVAILNRFNYRPHPVFQGYSAYTPELQRANAQFFHSDEAPEYVLWRYGTIDRRFPTLDDGQIILSLLGFYLPVAKEGEYVLWKRNALRGPGYALVPQSEVQGTLGEWVPIPADATWLRITLHETRFGAVQRFFCRASVPGIDVRLEDGRTKSYRLIPGNALSGFVVNPLLATEADLVLPCLKGGKPLRVAAVRVYSKKGSFDDAVRFKMDRIEGVPALGGAAGTH